VSSFYQLPRYKVIHVLVISLMKAQTDFRVALCDSFNTVQALEILLKLVSETNKYISSRQSAKSQISPELLSKIALWVTRMLRMFGLGEGPDDGGIGWGNPQGGSEENPDVRITPSYSFSHLTSHLPTQKEKLLMPYVEVLSTFRDTIRRMALDKNTTPKDILKACDVLRDDGLVPLGVALDDQDGTLH
jgi:cysteinyl-tRNA synthetase